MTKRNKKTKTTSPAEPIIGQVTTYHGDEHPYLRGHKVKIIAVLHNAAKPGINVDGPDYNHITDDEDLVRAGGVTAFDRIDVQPWLDSKERFSLVSSDPLAADLDCFRDLAAKVPDERRHPTLDGRQAQDQGAAQEDGGAYR